MTEVTHRLYRVLNQFLDELHPSRKEKHNIDYYSQLNRDLGLDSLGRAELLTRIEGEFDLILPDTLLTESKTLQDLIAGILAAEGKSKIANAKVWSTEFLSAKISVKLVNNINEAITHINKYGTMHTDAIISENKFSAKYFIRNVKSSIAIHNSSTQFADGGEFGFGGEVGISTNKLPPRGPVGLSQLVSYKYEIYGSGQIRK